MYKNAINKALGFTRPLLIGKLHYENYKIENDISSMIVLNKNGDILTTARNADIFISCKDYSEIYPPILKELSLGKKKQVLKLEKKYGITKDTIVGMQNIIIDIAKDPGDLKIIKHPYLDLAIIKIQNNDELLIKQFPKFIKNNPEVGTNICTASFAFPEYKAFKYDAESFKIISNYEFMNFPIFPTEGMICRNIADKEDKITMFEMSNLILKGMEGGPVLNKKGEVLGMIIGYRIIYDGIPNKIGLAINNKAIIDFLDNNNIEYEVTNEN